MPVYLTPFFGAFHSPLLEILVIAVLVAVAIVAATLVVASAVVFRFTADPQRLHARTVAM